MNHNAGRLLRLAAAIHLSLQPETSEECLPALPEATWRQCQKLFRQLHRARAFNWQFAAARVQRNLHSRLQELRQELYTIEMQLAPQYCSPQASVRDIYIDLAALEEEFGEVEHDHMAKTISVTTEPIELEEIYLGPFRIQLDWSDLTDHPHNYQVIAVDPQPAASNDGVTHPHVQDESVCEGDGRQPIKHALRDGRLFDFFTLVANLLRTYNSGSPYVSLSDWHGVTCSDCDALAGDGNRYICDRCDVDVCGDCITTCPDCDCIYCAGCTSRCAQCEEQHCLGCLTPCHSCDSDCCRECLNDHERCKHCHDKHENPRATEPIPIPDVHAACYPESTVFTDSVGEVAFLA